MREYYQISNVTRRMMLQAVGASVVVATAGCGSDRGPDTDSSVRSDGGETTVDTGPSETDPPSEPAESGYFEVQVKDERTNEGVPLVKLRTTGEERYYTDSAGRVAIDDPGLQGERVFFNVTSHGYRYPTGPADTKGRAVDVEPGRSAVILVDRDSIAERLYRVTGRGIYRDSVELDRDVPLANPVLNGKVTGQDSVHTAVYHGHVYWFWGDTRRIDAPLGNFRTAGATSRLPDDGGLDPADGVDLNYFEGRDGFAAPLAPLPSDEGDLMWIDQVMTVPDSTGDERLVARYTHVVSLDDTAGQGILVFDDDSERFELAATDMEFTRGHGGQATRYEDPESGDPYWFVANPWPDERVPDEFEAVRDETAYEHFTCLEPGESWSGPESSSVHHDGGGDVVWGWKPETEPVSQSRERELIDAGRLSPDDARWQLRDAETETTVTIHRASVKWNAYRENWVMIGTEIDGDGSNLGEVWFAEAAAPTGPWRWARKVVTHDDYSFYNPKQHAFFDQEGGRYVYFEGTYTNSFSGTETPTPLYDYNQVMYRLDLAHPELDLPLEP